MPTFLSSWPMADGSDGAPAKTPDTLELLRSCRFCYDRKVAVNEVLAALRAPDAPGEQTEDRAFIEARFREGMSSAEVSLAPEDNPYDAASLAGHWWSRGYAYQARLMRAIAAEATIARLTKALRELAATADSYLREG